MANDKRFIVKNGLQTPNVSFKDSNESLNEITVEMLGTDTLSFSGDAGQLFSLTDTLSGTIFSVNDISGIPSIEVDDDGTIRLAEFAGNVLIGTDSDDGSNKLQLTGNAKITGNFETTGNVTVGGTVDGRDVAADGSKLDGIEVGATADQTANEILTAIKTVDGAGSGLDADLLDGAQPSVAASNDTIVKRHSSGYIYANYFNTSPNDVTSGVTKVLVETGNDGFMRHGTQAAIRTFIGAGSGNGLDADLLDGQHGSHYLDFTNFTNLPDPQVTVALTGEVTGTATGTLTNLGNGTVSVATTIAANSVALGTDTTGNYVATVAGTANEIEVLGSGSETAAVTIGLPNNVTIGNNLTVTGNLTVSGTTTTVNTETINLADNIITLNSNYTGSTPTENSGLEVERGTLTNALIQWNENNDYWEIASGGTVGRILTTGDEGTGNGLDADLLDGVQGSSYLRSDANDTATGIITFRNSSDYQIALNGNSTSWAGISWTDNAGTDYMWFNGSTGTFAIGGGGSIVSGKKLHVNGGMSVGASASSTAMPTNGIYSQGAISVGGNTVWHAGNDGTGSGLDADLLDGQHASAFQTVAAPNAPSITSTTVVNETIELVFGQSSTSGVTRYEVWSDGATGSDYSLIAIIPAQDAAASMSIIDTSFDTGGTVAYRVYAIKNGVYSTAATTTKSFTIPSLDVTNMSVVSSINNYDIQYDLPETRFLDHIEIYKDAETTLGALSRTGAALVYSGSSDNFTYSPPSADKAKYHQFWVECVSV